MKKFIGKHCDLIGAVVLLPAFVYWILAIHFTENPFWTNRQWASHVLIVTVAFWALWTVVFAVLLHCEREYRWDKYEARKRHISYQHDHSEHDHF